MNYSNTNSTFYSPSRAAKTPRKELCNASECDSTGNCTEKNRRYFTSNIDFFYQPPHIDRPAKDLDEIVFRPESRQEFAKNNERQKREYSEISEFFTPLQEPVHQRYFPERDSKDVFNILGIHDHLM